MLHCYINYTFWLQPLHFYLNLVLLWAVFQDFFSIIQLLWLKCNLCCASSSDDSDCWYQDMYQKSFIGSILITSSNCLFDMNVFGYCTTKSNCFQDNQVNMYSFYNIVLYAACFICQLNFLNQWKDEKKCSVRMAMHWSKMWLKMQMNCRQHRGQ